MSRFRKADANASVDSLTTRFAVEARQTFQKHLEELFQGEDEQPPSEPDPSPFEADQEPETLPVTLGEEEREMLLAQSRLI